MNFGAMAMGKTDAEKETANAIVVETETIREDGTAMITDHRIISSHFDSFQSPLLSARYCRANVKLRQSYLAAIKTAKRSSS